MKVTLVILVQQNTYELLTLGNGETDYPLAHSTLPSVNKLLLSLHISLAANNRQEI